MSGSAGSGVAFSCAADGDLRDDGNARATWCRRLGITYDWAWARQVHAATAVQVTVPGPAGDADALFTDRPVPVAVFTADCLGVIVHGRGGVGAAHAGWRGLAAGVIESLLEAMRAAGMEPQRAAVGPGIGPCCFEVGDEVRARFPASWSTTSWGTESVDIWSEAERRLAGLEVWASRQCTMHDDGMWSHRRDRTTSRMAAVGWI